MGKVTVTQLKLTIVRKISRAIRPTNINHNKVVKRRVWLWMAAVESVRDVLVSMCARGNRFAESEGQ